MKTQYLVAWTYFDWIVNRSRNQQGYIAARSREHAIHIIKMRYGKNLTSVECL